MKVFAPSPFSGPLDKGANGTEAFVIRDRCGSLLRSRLHERDLSHHLGCANHGPKHTSSKFDKYHMEVMVGMQHVDEVPDVGRMEGSKRSFAAKCAS